MNALFSSIIRWGFLLLILGGSTLLLFGPIWGFHHSFSFGILNYMVWDGEESSSGIFQIDGYGVGINPYRLFLTLVCWAMLCGFAFFVTRPRTKNTLE